MGTQRLCRIVASTVAACRVALATAVTAHFVPQRSLAFVPLGSQLTPAMLSGDALGRDTATTGAMIAALGAPLVRTWRALGRIVPVERRAVLGCLALAALGSLGSILGIPSATAALIGVLLCWLPVAFVATDGRFRVESTSQPATERAIVVGDSEERIEQVLRETEFPVVGYVAPASRPPPGRRDVDLEPTGTAVRLTDGGAVDARLGDFHRLGGLSGLSGVFEDYDVDRAILAFAAPDRTDFFGALAACDDHGVSATVPDEFAESVLVEEARNGTVDVDLEPWGRWECLVKRCFDTAFAVAGLVVLVPAIVVIAAVIKLDSAGPILYSQDRTTKFGRTFRLYKFRTMTPGSGDAAPITDEENTNITRVGRFLRRTHLDEIPQLYSILVGDMSVVGPRATWIAEEEDFLDVGNGRWRKRWFVEPGLTGLAQINDVSSTNPELKLHYDLEYIDHQSFAFDVWLVAQQIRIVLADLLSR